MNTSGNPCHDFIHRLNWQEIPGNVQAMARQCLLDLLAVAASGTSTNLSQTIREHALNHFGTQSAANGARLLFDGRRCSPLGATLANGMTIDSIDAHDGYKPCKGHAGCGVLPATLAFLEHEQAGAATEEELLTCLVIGYEIACRAGVALHASVSDYHTSGAWVALACAAVGARTLKLDQQQTRHALGIAEYHGPRSQMMRCIDHPAMLKDGSGWGAMAGVSAAYLARDGFTGAPAITTEQPEHAATWSNLGQSWLILEQYFKPYPVCRWAQPAVVAAMALQVEHQFNAGDIQSVTVGTFHESARLAIATPSTTEEAQYSLSFPVAAALVHQRLTVNEIAGAGLNDETVIRLSQSIELNEVDAYNQVFPNRRISEVQVTLNDGRVLQSGPTEANGDPELPLSEAELTEKFFNFAQPALGDMHCQLLLSNIKAMGSNKTLAELFSLIFKTIK